MIFEYILVLVIFVRAHTVLCMYLHLLRARTHYDLDFVRKIHC